MFDKKRLMSLFLVFTLLLSFFVGINNNTFASNLTDLEENLAEEDLNVIEINNRENIKNKQDLKEISNENGDVSKEDGISLDINNETKEDDEKVNLDNVEIKEDLDKISLDDDKIKNGINSDNNETKEDLEEVVLENDKTKVDEEEVQENEKKDKKETKQETFKNRNITDAFDFELKDFIGENGEIGKTNTLGNNFYKKMNLHITQKEDIVVNDRDYIYIKFDDKFKSYSYRRFNTYDMQNKDRIGYITVDESKNELYKFSVIKFEKFDVDLYLNDYNEMLFLLRIKDEYKETGNIVLQNFQLVRDIAFNLNRENFKTKEDYNNLTHLNILNKDNQVIYSRYLKDDLDKMKDNGLFSYNYETSYFGKYSEEVLGYRPYDFDFTLIANNITSGEKIIQVTLDEFGLSENNELSYDFNNFESNFKIYESEKTNIFTHNTKYIKEIPYEIVGISDDFKNIYLKANLESDKHYTFESTLLKLFNYKKLFHGLGIAITDNETFDIDNNKWLLNEPGYIKDNTNNSLYFNQNFVLGENNSDLSGELNIEEYKDIKVEKIWSENSPKTDKITVILLADGTPVKKMDLDESTNWKGVFEKEYKNTEVEYTVKEVEIPNYTSKVEGDALTGFVITNTFEKPTTDLEISKTSDKDKAKYGEFIKYTLEVKNTVENSETGEIVLTDTLPEGLELLKDSLKANKEDAEIKIEGNQILITLEDLSFEETLIVEYTTKVITNENTTLTNKLNVKNEKNKIEKETEKEVEIEKPTTDLEISKTSDKDKAKYGEFIKYTLEVKNIVENSETGEIVLTDTLPEGLELLKDSLKVNKEDVEIEIEGNQILITLEDLSFEETLIVEYTTKVITNENTTLTNKLNVKNEKNKIEKETEKEVEIEKVGKLEIKKTVDKDKVYKGDTVKYTIEIKNSLENSIIPYVSLEDIIDEEISIDFTTLKLNGKEVEFEKTPSGFVINIQNLEYGETNLITYSAKVNTTVLNNKELENKIVGKTYINEKDFNNNENNLEELEDSSKVIVIENTEKEDNNNNNNNSETNSREDNKISHQTGDDIFSTFILFLISLITIIKVIRKKTEL